MLTDIQEHPSDVQNGFEDVVMDEVEQDEFHKPYDHNDLCDSNPDFPVICSFISRFGPTIDLQLNIEWLEESIENQESLDDGLIEIHVKLLKKLRRYFNRDQWERALVRFAYEYSNEDGYELESLGYLRTRPSIKLGLLRRLLDAQFECDAKFKASVNALEANELRNQPTGRDNKGNTYWHCVDDEGSLRVYRDQPLDYTAWNTVCKNSVELKNLIGELDKEKDDKVKGEPQLEPYNPYSEIFSELFIKQETPIIEQAKPKSEPSKRLAKKGKGRLRNSSPLQTLKEIDENTILDDCPPNNNPSINEIPLSKDNRPRSISPNGNTSVESQVKHTIETILNRVTSSIDYIFRRSSPDSSKQSSLNHKVDESGSKKSKKKREKRQVPELPRRTSSRIQQLQQKKVQEEEENLKKKLVEAAKECSQRDENASRDSIVSEKPKKSASRSRGDKQRWRNSGSRKRLSWDKDDSDLSSTSSPTDSNDDESFMQAIDEANKDDNEDDEFACEEEETNDVPVIVKRARTARQSFIADDTGDLNNSTMIEEDKPCGRCDRSDDPESILLCDMCDDGYHTICCVPPLMYVPDGDWFCPKCEHKLLIEKLTEILDSVEITLAVKEREFAKRQKLRQAKKDAAAKPKTDELTSSRRRDNFINELNEPLAMQALDGNASSDEALSPNYKERAYKEPRKKTKRKKTNTNKKKSRVWSESDDGDYRWGRKSKQTYSRSNSDSESEGEDFTASSEAPDESEDSDKPKTRRARACVSYKFDEYDELIRSAIWADSDKIDAGLTDHEDDDDAGDTCNVGRGKDMATIEALAYQQENGLIAADAHTGGESNDIDHTKAQGGRRKKGRKLNDLDAESEIDIATSDESFQASATEEEEDEDEEEDEATEVTTDDSSIDEIIDIGNRQRCKKNKKRRRIYSSGSDDSDFLPRTRRAAAKQVSYRESTDEEDEPLRAYTPVSHPPKSLEDESRIVHSSPISMSNNMTPPQAHPHFYDDDEINPSTSSPNDNDL